MVCSMLSLPATRSSLLAAWPLLRMAGTSRCSTSEGGDAASFSCTGPQAQGQVVTADTRAATCHRADLDDESFAVQG